MAKKKKKKSDEGTTGMKLWTYRAFEKDHDLWEEAAEEESLTLSAWLRQTLNKAAKKVLRNKAREENER